MWVRPWVLTMEAIILLTTMITSSNAFGAPWSTLLKVATAFSVVVLAGVGITFITVVPRDLAAGLPFSFAMLSVFGTFSGSALFVVRGYEIEPNVLLVRRLLWSTRIPLDNLTNAWADETAMKGSLRLFGNGGLFVFAGLFTNRKLGRYRAFATQPRNSVVLKFTNRTLVVTPDRPLEFLQTLSLFYPQVKMGPAEQPAPLSLH
jgi:Bacterial PH domain